MATALPALEQIKLGSSCVRCTHGAEDISAHVEVTDSERVGKPTSEMNEYGSAAGNFNGKASAVTFLLLSGPVVVSRTDG